LGKYTCVLALQHIKLKTSSGHSRCPIPTLGLKSECPTCSMRVCVCAYAHTNTPVHVDSLVFLNNLSEVSNLEADTVCLFDVFLGPVWNRRTGTGHLLGPQIIDHKYVVERHQYVMKVTLKHKWCGEQVRHMWKLIITHLYLPSMWDEGKPNSLHSHLKDFDFFEEYDWWLLSLSVTVI